VAQWLLKIPTLVMLTKEELCEMALHQVAELHETARALRNIERAWTLER
jgi:hypothetical protein